MIGDAAGGINRGLAVLGDRLFMVTDHAHLIALHRATGQLLWDVEVADIHRVIHRRRNGVALSGDQRGRDRASVALDDCANTAINAFANSVNGRRDAQPDVGRRWRVRQPDGAERKAGRRDATKIKIARKIIAAWPQRLERRTSLALNPTKLPTAGAVPLRTDTRTRSSLSLSRAPSMP